ncbi:MAG TPA: DUF4349 domain-containing protein [Candidatus Limnocylindrales bacterium]|nr:DUF4349 domain-containing protein [Candidatus Limnocylindrales bacterium]
MDEHTEHDYKAWAVLGAVILLVLVVGSVFLGGQTSTILSKVGSSVGGSEGNTGSGVDTTGNDPAADTGDTTGGAVVADAAAQPPALLIVRTGTLELETASLDTIVVAAGNVVTAAGGYVSGSNETAAGDDSSATVAYRIPATAWDTTVASLRGLATVRHQQVDTEEVTGQVVDLGARIANLRATEAALQAIMARATKISDVLDVQKQLTTTRGEIERLVADKTELEGRAAYGSLKVTFSLPAPAAVTTAAKGWDPATDVDRATGKLIAIAQRATTAGIFLGIVGFPLLIGGGILVVVAWQLVRLGRWVVARRTVGEGLPG